jgi:hypothetical protein
MSVLKHLKTLQHVSSFSDHLQGARRFLVKVTEFKIFKFSVFNMGLTSSLTNILLYIEVHQLACKIQ